MADRRYVYRNSKSLWNGQHCRAVLDGRGKCIRSRKSTMLVEFDCGTRVVVSSPQLRKEPSDA